MTPEQLRTRFDQMMAETSDEELASEFESLCPSDATNCSPSSIVIEAVQLKEIVACLEDGRIQWIMWAHSWQRDRAYGNGQPEIHPTHAGVIARFDKALTDLGHPPENK